MIKAALKRSCNLTNTPAYYFRDTSDSEKKEIHRWVLKLIQSQSVLYS